MARRDSETMCYRIRLVPVVVLSAILAAGACAKHSNVDTRPECSLDTDCPDGSSCMAGKCIRKAPEGASNECRQQNDCGGTRVCREGRCVDDCLSDGECAAGLACVNQRCARPSECSMERIHFGFDRFDLAGDAQGILRNNAECIRQSRISRLTVEGHCDNRGTEEYNLALGQRRAQAVIDYLTSLGVERSVLQAVSFGEEQPLDTRNSESAWAKNRRAELVSSGR